MMAGAMATKTAHTGQSSGLTSHESRPLVVSNESGTWLGVGVGVGLGVALVVSNEAGTCARRCAWRLPEGCREVCEAACREGPCTEGTEGCVAAPRSDAVRQLVQARCGRGARAVQARCRRGKGVSAVQARCRRGAGAVQARWATHLERGDGHVRVALVLVLGRQPVVVAHVGHCAEEDHRGRRAVVRDEGADPPLKDAPTARACGAWGGAAAVPRAAASSTKAPRGPRAQGSSTARG